MHHCQTPSRPKPLNNRLEGRCGGVQKKPFGVGSSVARRVSYGMWVPSDPHNHGGPCTRGGVSVKATNDACSKAGDVGKWKEPALSVSPGSIPHPAPR
jgi:hypothetical protein